MPGATVEERLHWLEEQVRKSQEHYEDVLKAIIEVASSVDTDPESMSMTYICRGCEELLAGRRDGKYAKKLLGE